MTKLVKFDIESIKNELKDNKPIKNSLVILRAFTKAAFEQKTPIEEINGVLTLYYSVSRESDNYIKQLLDIIYDNTYSEDDILIDLREMK